MKVSVILDFLYKTVPGRMLLRLLVQPEVSEMAARFLASGASRYFVPCYIHINRINMSDVETPEGGFASFRDFFTRKRRWECYDITDGHLISPCDGLLTFAKIREDTVFSIKNTNFSLYDLLKDRSLAAEFQDGNAFIFRLTPADYHRYCYVADGDVIRSRKIKGKLHCVRPVALREVPVFIQNSREYQVISTERFGMIVQMEIGALLVGRIKNHRRTSAAVRKGEEKGYFEFGGSTILVLTQRDKVCFREKLWKRRSRHGEVKVHMGEFIAEVNTP